MSDIGYIHLSVGITDFATCGIRCEMLLGTYSLKRPKRRKRPPDAGVHAWVGNNVHQASDPADGEEIWDSAGLSFSVVCARAKFGT